MYVYCDILSKHALFRRSFVLSGHFRRNSQKQNTGYHMVFASDQRMWPYGQTPPLDKCEQLDSEHPKAMLQNDIDHFHEWLRILLFFCAYVNYTAGLTLT